ncbi:MAG: leucyl aminopeptidase family protein, partial [Pseudomonadota bacterium]
ITLIPALFWIVKASAPGMIEATLTRQNISENSNMNDIQIRQGTQLPDKKLIDRAPSVLFVTPVSPAVKVWRSLPYGERVRERRRRSGRAGQNNDIFSTDLSNERGTQVLHVPFNPQSSSFECLGRAREAIAKLAESDPSEYLIVLGGLAEDDNRRVAEALVAAALARAATLPSFKSKPKKAARLKRIRLMGAQTNDRLARTQAEANGNALARELSVLPPNDLTPTTYRKRVEVLAKQYGWSMNFLDQKTLKRRGAGAFLAVVQGSPVPDAGIVHLSYRPKSGRGRGRVALVGKGICYDTGGVNVKPNKFMLGMHEDMQGSAVALGTLLALTELEVDFSVDCWLAIAMNHIGSRAYQPNDVVKAADGTTIEVIHTDAEGRMVLADTLTFASKRNPSVIIDYATLTGACVYSLGKSYSGVFSNQDDWMNLLIEAGRDSGERVWPFPQDEDYDRALESSVADIRQCSVDGEADHIMAARFLRRFVKNDTPWVHIDLAASSRRGGLAHIPTDTTGFGVRYTLELLLSKDLLARTV